MAPNDKELLHLTSSLSSNPIRSSEDNRTEEEGEDYEEQLFFITAYTDFDCLAHGPRGLQAKMPIYIYRFHPNDGSMVLLNIAGKDKSATTPLINPAFSRFHPRLNVIYTCTEDVLHNGIIVAYRMDPNGSLVKLGQVDAGGTSTCYITIDKSEQHLIVTNYWNSTLCVIPIDPLTGAFTGEIMSSFDPKDGCQMQANAKLNGGCNHSLNDENTIEERQKDPHSHALVLDPFQGCIAYVPDLGKDLVRELLYDTSEGVIIGQLSVLPSGISTGKQADGPRYIEFHPLLDVAYVVNELSSTIAVFSVNRNVVNDVARASREGKDLSCIKELTNSKSTLQLIQSIKTIPDAFPTEMNTCGRVTVHPSGKFVIVSNRGHESIAIFRVCKKGATAGHLRQIGFYHTYGETPRHFQFDASGQYLIVANQDSNSIAVFSFNLSSGDIKYTGNKYRIPSPNFVCNCVLNDKIISRGSTKRLPETVTTTIASDTLFQNTYESSDSSAVSCNSIGQEGFTNYKVVNENDDISKEELLLELRLAREEINRLKVQLAHT